MSLNNCYGMHNGVIQSIPGGLPCGTTNSTHPHVSCCMKGDNCLSNSICQQSQPSNHALYYTADCTDKTLTDPACSTRCGGRKSSLIAYNRAGFWACCEKSATGEVNCNDPSQELYPGPPSWRLTTIHSLSLSTLNTHTSSATSAGSIPTHTTTESAIDRPISTGYVGEVAHVESNSVEIGYASNSDSSPYQGTSSGSESPATNGLPIFASLFISILVVACALFILSVLALTSVWYYRRKSLSKHRIRKEVDFTDFERGKSMNSSITLVSL